LPQLHLFLLREGPSHPLGQRKFGGLKGYIDTRLSLDLRKHSFALVGNLDAIIKRFLGHPPEPSTVLQHIVESGQSWAEERQVGCYDSNVLTSSQQRLINRWMYGERTCFDVFTLSAKLNKVIARCPAIWATVIIVPGSGVGSVAARCKTNAHTHTRLWQIPEELEANELGEGSDYPGKFDIAATISGEFIYTLQLQMKYQSSG
jgi:hypothetical protein